MTECLRPQFNVMHCDVRVAEDKSPLAEGTRVIMLLGEFAMLEWLPHLAGKNTLNEIRGSVLSYNGVPCICSYYPQDAADLKAFERTTNPNSKEYAPDEEKDKDEEDGDEKRITHTKRSNYFFWLKADTRKAVHIATTGVVPTEPQPKYISFPNSADVVSVLSDNKDKFFYFDMETDYEAQNLQCFSFTFDGLEIYNVPVLDHNYHPAYSANHYIYRALFRAVTNNVVVAHNGACFDYLVLGYKYRIPVRRVYDTMIAMHRCFPDVEKSLGHFTSYWTWQPFHKDEDSRGYMTREQVTQRMAYCGKDVFTMYLGHKALDKYASTIPGLQHSIQTAQDSVVPYLTTTLQGICYDPTEVVARRKENDRLMMQYLRIIHMLIGDSGMATVKGYLKGKSKAAFPTSNAQCCAYFHDILGYPEYLGLPDKHGKRHPSLAKKNMFRLRLKHDNPVLDMCNLYRGVKLETTTPLGFRPWKDDEGNIISDEKFNAIQNSQSQDIQTIIQQDLREMGVQPTERREGTA